LCFRRWLKPIEHPLAEAKANHIGNNKAQANESPLKLTTVNKKTHQKTNSLHKNK
jgi:hypothetical protein